MDKLDENDIKFLKDVNHYIDKENDSDDNLGVPNGDELAIIIRKVEDCMFHLEIV